MEAYYGNNSKNKNEVFQYTPSKDELNAYEIYKKLKKEDISDIPELTTEQLVLAVKAREIRKKLYKPVKVPVKINYDADVLEWFRSSGKGYQTRMNNVLRGYMLDHLHGNV